MITTKITAMLKATARMMLEIVMLSRVENR